MLTNWYRLTPNANLYDMIFIKSTPELLTPLLKIGRKKKKFFSPTPRARLKCTKMWHYHRELCKREQQAKTRNLELLRSAESLVLKAKGCSVDYTVLHHLKVFLLATILQNAAYELDYKSWYLSYLLLWFWISHLTQGFSDSLSFFFFFCPNADEMNVWCMFCDPVNVPMWCNILQFSYMYWVIVVWNVHGMLI